MWEKLNRVNKFPAQLSEFLFFIFFCFVWLKTPQHYSTLAARIVWETQNEPLKIKKAEFFARSSIEWGTMCGNKFSVLSLHWLGFIDSLDTFFYLAMPAKGEERREYQVKEITFNCETINFYSSLVTFTHTHSKAWQNVNLNGKRASSINEISGWSLSCA